jgi:hypothetical protein
MPNMISTGNAKNTQELDPQAEQFFYKELVAPGLKKRAERFAAAPPGTASKDPNAPLGEPYQPIYSRNKGGRRKSKRRSRKTKRSRRARRTKRR